MDDTDTSVDHCDRLLLAVKHCRSSFDTLHDYSAELDELTRCMDRHRLQPALHHYVRAVGALLDATPPSQPPQPLLHIECLSPSLSLHLTPLTPSAITLQPSPLLHSLLSHKPTLLSTAPYPPSGYLSLTVDHQVRLVSLPSDVLSSPLLGVYSCSPPSTRAAFVQCVHFLYSRAITRLTVAPLTFLFLSLHRRRTELYEVSATMDDVAIEHCEARIPLSHGSLQQLSVPLRPLSADRIRLLWGDTDGTLGVEGSSQQSMGESTATTEADATAGTAVSTWLGVYSEGESELGEEQWPTSPVSLRSPSPLAASPPKPHQRRVTQPASIGRAGRTRTDCVRDRSVARDTENSNSVNSDRVAARSAAAAAEHLLRAKNAATARTSVLAGADEKKRQLAAASERMRGRRAKEITARKVSSAAAAAAVERSAAAGRSNTVKRSEQRRVHEEDGNSNQHSAADHDSRIQQQTREAHMQQAGADGGEQSRPRSSADQLLSVSTPQAGPIQHTVRDAVVRVDDTRSECETEERRRDIQQRTKQRMERRLRKHHTRHSRSPQTASSHPSTAFIHHTAVHSPTQPPLAALLHQHSFAPPPLSSTQPNDIISLLLFPYVDSPRPPLSSVSPTPSPAALRDPLNAAWQLLCVIMQAARHAQPLSIGVAIDSEAVDQQRLTHAVQPVNALNPSAERRSAHSEDVPLTDCAAAHCMPAAGDTEAAPLGCSDELGELSSKGVAATASDATAPTSSTSTPPAVQRDDSTRQCDESSMQQCHSDGGMTRADGVEGVWMHQEEKYPLTPHARRVDEQHYTTLTQPDTPMSSVELSMEGGQWSGQSDELSLPAASTRSPSLSPSQSASPYPSDTEHPDDLSEDEWRARSMSLSAFSPPHSTPATMSLELSCTSHSTISALSAQCASIHSLAVLGIPRINAGGVAGSWRSTLVGLNGSEDEDDEEEETVLSKYVGVGRSRKQRNRSSGRS